MRFLSILALAYLSFACSKPASLEGTWHEVDGDRTMTFENTVVTVSNGQHTILAKYEVIDETTMAWGMPHAVSPFPVKYELDGDKLVLQVDEEEVVYWRE